MPDTRTISGYGPAHAQAPRHAERQLIVAMQACAVALKRSEGKGRNPGARQSQSNNTRYSMPGSLRPPPPRRPSVHMAKGHAYGISPFDVHSHARSRPGRMRDRRQASGRGYDELSALRWSVSPPLVRLPLAFVPRARSCITVLGSSLCCSRHAQHLTRTSMQGAAFDCEAQRASSIAVSWCAANILLLCVCTNQPSVAAKYPATGFGVWTGPLVFV